MILGVDTASVAGNRKIDWRAARAAGCEFAFLRATWGAAPDTAFAREWDRVREAGIVRGAYLFLRFPRAGTVAPSPEAQVAGFIRAVGSPQPGDFPPTLDLEFPGNGIGDTSMTPVEALAWTHRARIALVDFYKVNPILYTSARVWRDDLRQSTDDRLAGCPLWLARYPLRAGVARVAPLEVDALQTPPVPPPWGGENWWIHQYQGNASGFPGFDSLVDMNRWNQSNPSGARAAWVEARLGGASLSAFQAARGVVEHGIGPRTFAYLAWQIPHA